MTKRFLSVRNSVCLLTVGGVPKSVCQFRHCYWLIRKGCTVAALLLVETNRFSVFFRDSTLVLLWTIKNWEIPKTLLKQCCQVPKRFHCHFTPKPRPFWHLPRPHATLLTFILFWRLTCINLCSNIFLRTFFHEFTKIFFMIIMLLRTVCFDENDRDNGPLATLIIIKDTFFNFYHHVFYLYALVNI
jgi:hypothetical protein